RRRLVDGAARGRGGADLRHLDVRVGLRARPLRRPRPRRRRARGRRPRVRRLMLHEPSRFEPLSDEPWDERRVGTAIAAVVADADAAFDPTSLWPADEWDAYREGQPLKALYSGAAGVVWALDALRRGGHAETTLDLAAIALQALELERADPEARDDEHWTPGSLLDGETGPLLVAFRLTADPALADELHDLVRANAGNPTDDISWGAPGTILVALAMHELTEEERWLEAARESAGALRARRGEDGVWRQDDDYRGLGTLHGAAGNTLAILRVAPDERLATARSACSGAPARPESSPGPGTTSTRSSSSPPPSSSGRPARTATRRATASATAPRGTASRSSRRSRARGTSSGWSAPAASPSTLSRRRDGRPRRTGGAAIRCSPATSAPRSSPLRVSTRTRASRSSMSSERLTFAPASASCGDDGARDRPPHPARRLPPAAG